MNVTLLTNDEIHRIASAIQEDFGTTLSTSELRDVICTYFDNISGLETVSESDLQWLSEQVVNSYLTTSRSLTN